MAKRKVFTKEFKREAVRLLEKDEKPAAQWLGNTRTPIISHYLIDFAT
jgi:hypothetical protein